MVLCANVVVPSNGSNNMFWLQRRSRACDENGENGWWLATRCWPSKL